MKAKKGKKTKKAAAGQDANAGAAKDAKAAKPKQKAKAAKKQKMPVESRGVEITLRKKILGEAPKEYHFVLSDGRTVGSLKQLADELRQMSEDMFRSHVNDFRNDFASWVHDVFEEQSFADELKGINSRLETEVACLRKILKEIEHHRKA